MRLLNELEDIETMRKSVNCTCVCILQSGLMPQVIDSSGQCFYSPKESYGQKAIWRMLLAR